MRQGDAKADDGSRVAEEAEHRLLEVPPVETHLHCQLAAEAKHQRAGDALHGDRQRDEAKNDGPPRAPTGDAEQAARHAHDHRPAKAEMDRDDHQRPIGRQRVDLADCEATVGRHQRRQGVGDQDARRQEGQHDDEERQRGRDVEGRA